LALAQCRMKVCVHNIMLVTVTVLVLALAFVTTGVIVAAYRLLVQRLKISKPRRALVKFS
jgi:energy-converting hydrogenase Eha subunit A